MFASAGLALAVVILLSELSVVALDEVSNPMFSELERELVEMAKFFLVRFRFKISSLLLKR